MAVALRSRTADLDQLKSNILLAADKNDVGEGEGGKPVLKLPLFCKLVELGAFMEDCGSAKQLS